jgi:hypothetical protein
MKVKNGSLKQRMDVRPDSAQMEGDSSMTIREVPAEMMGCLQNIEQYMNARLEAWRCWLRRFLTAKQRPARTVSTSSK